MRQSTTVLCAIVALLVPLVVSAGNQSPVTVGESLFLGTTPFKNGGPPCASCHNSAGLPFPQGGTLGPNLSREYAKMGPEGMDAALETLYFPTMYPIFTNRPLTESEQSDLKAFFEQAQNQPLPANLTPVVAGIGVIGFLVLLAVTWALWRGRVRNIRRPMVQQAKSAGGR